jgi:hypothetical protein
MTCERNIYTNSRRMTIEIDNKLLSRRKNKMLLDLVNFRLKSRLGLLEGENKLQTGGGGYEADKSVPHMRVVRRVSQPTLLLQVFCVKYLQMSSAYLRWAVAHHTIYLCVARITLAEVLLTYLLT